MFRHKRFHIRNPSRSVSGDRLCGLGICFLVVAPSWVGDSWSHLLKTDPVSTIGLCGFGALWLYCALGMPWVESLNRRFNRFDLEREITIAPDGVRIARGEKVWKKKWSEFVCYYETAVLYILQTRGFEFWAIPKRAFETGIDRSFHEIFNSWDNTGIREPPNYSPEPTSGFFLTPMLARIWRRGGDC